MPHRPYALGRRPRASHPPAPHHCHAAAIRYRAAALTAADAWVPSSPKQGQKCRAYCAYRFRWAQFVDEPELKMATDHIEKLAAYLREHREVTRVLITGGTR